MKKILLLLSVLFLFSCDSKSKKTEIIQEIVPIEEVEFSSEETLETETAEDIAFEKALEEVAIEGKNLQIEESSSGGFVMSFDSETLKQMTQQIKQQRNDMETKVAYDSEDDRKSAVEAINMSLALFEGEFCCVTHNKKHCADATELKKLEDKYKCLRFKKK